MTLRNQKSTCETKADPKKSKGDADLKKLAKIPFISGADRKKSWT